MNEEETKIPTAPAESVVYNCRACGAEMDVFDWVSGRRDPDPSRQRTCYDCFRAEIERGHKIMDALGKEAQRTGDFSKLDRFYISHMSVFGQGQDAAAEVQMYQTGQENAMQFDLPRLGDWVETRNREGHWEKNRVVHVEMFHFRVSGNRNSHTRHSYGKSWRNW